MKKELIFNELGKKEQAIVDLASEIVALTEVIPMTNEPKKNHFKNIFLERIAEIERIGYKIDQEQPSDKINYGIGIELPNVCPMFSFSHTHLINFSLNINYSQASRWFHYYMR